MQKKHAGQALVEFVILLPIFIFMLFAIIDIGKILYFKNNLESRMDDVITEYASLKNETLLQKKLEQQEDTIQVEMTHEDDYLVFELKKPLAIITPGLNLIFGNPYSVSVKRVIYDES